MDNTLINNYTNSPISREAGVRTNLSQTNSRLFNVGANFMPTERQTAVGVFNAGAVPETALEKRRYSMPRIYSPEGSPSSVTTVGVTVKPDSTNDPAAVVPLIISTGVNVDTLLQGI